MKKITLGLVAATMAVLVGCKTVPSPEKLEVTANAVGIAAAMVANQTKIDDASRATIIEIITEVDKCVPATNQTFEAAWTPIAQEHVAKLLEEGKIDAGQAKLILGAFDVAVKGVDYLIAVKYPAVAKYGNLLEAATHGFCKGFLTYFKPVNGVVSASSEVEYDVEAYEYLNARFYLSNKMK